MAKEKKVKAEDTRTPDEKLSALLDAFKEGIETEAEAQGVTLRVIADVEGKTLTTEFLPDELEEMGAESVKLSTPTRHVITVIDGTDTQYQFPFFDFQGSDSKISIAKVYLDRIDEKQKRATEKVVARVVPYARAHAAAAREELAKVREDCEAAVASSTEPMALVSDGKTLIGETHLGDLKISRYMDAGSGIFRGVAITGGLTTEQVKAIEEALA